MSTEVATPPAAAPVMQKAIIPPPNTSDASVAASFDKARQDRIANALKPKATEPAKTPDVPATKPVETAPASETQKAEVKPVSIFAPKDAPPPASAPSTETDPADKMRLPDPAPAESVTNFANLAKVAKERKQLADRLASELEVARSSASAQPNAAEKAEIERLRTEHKAAVDRLAILDIQNHPDFSRQYTQPKKAALATAAEVIAYNEKTAPDMVALLTKPMKEFNATVSELTKDMNSADAATVAQSLRQARELQTQEQAALSSSSELRTQLQAKTQLEQKRAFEAVAAEVVPHFAKRDITDGMSPEERQSVLDYNQSVETLRTRAEAQAFGKVSERDVATMAFKSAAMDHLVTHAVPYLERYAASQNAIIANLTAELQSLRGGNAPANLGGVKQASAVDPSKMTREERTHYFLHGAGRPGAKA